MRTDAERAAEMAEYYEKEFAARVKHLADRLRQLADDIERKGVIPESGLFLSAPPAADTAYEILHEITWTFANMNAIGLVTVAGNVDVNRARAAR